MKIERLLLLLIFIIILIIICEFIKLNTLKNCPNPIIEYKYITRTFNEEQNKQIPLDNIFNKMFANPSPWMLSKGIGISDKRDTNLEYRKLKI
jgi:hypothetical protein